MKPRFSFGMVAAAMVALATAGTLTGLFVPLILAAALLLVLAVSTVHAVLAQRFVTARCDRGATARVARGESARVTIELRAPFAWGRGTLRMAIPEELGGPRHVYAQRRLSIDLPTKAHGPHECGAITLEHSDIFGLFHLSTPVKIQGSGVLIPVSPAVRSRHRSRVRGRASATELGYHARPYVIGDDLRRIHWKASSRTGDLMTRDLEAGEGDLVILVNDPALVAACSSEKQAPYSGEARELAERAVDRIVDRAISALDNDREVAVGATSHLLTPRTDAELLDALAHGHITHTALPIHRVRSASCTIFAAPGAADADVKARVGERFPILLPALDHAVIERSGGQK